MFVFVALQGSIRQIDLLAQSFVYQDELTVMTVFLLAHPAIKVQALGSVRVVHRGNFAMSSSSSGRQYWRKELRTGEMTSRDKLPKGVPFLFVQLQEPY